MHTYTLLYSTPVIVALHSFEQNQESFLPMPLVICIGNSAHIFLGQLSQLLVAASVIFSSMHGIQFLSD